MTISKDLHVYLLLYQSLYDLTNPNGYNLTSVLVLINDLGHTFISVLNLNQFAWPQLDISSWSYQSTWPQIDISPCSYKPSQVPGNTHNSTLLGHAFFNCPRLFLFSISLIFVINQPQLKYL